MTHWIPHELHNAEHPLATAIDASQLREWGVDHLWMQGGRGIDLVADNQYQIIVRGEGCYIFDSDGTRLIDGTSSGFVKAIGHGRPEIPKAIANQIARLSYTPNSFGQVSVPAIELARKLAELMPGGLHRTFFCTGGSHAVEVSIQIARQYHAIRGDVRRYKVISRRPEYHGSTYATMSLGTHSDRNAAIFEPLMPGVLQVDAPHCYRCPWGSRGRTPENCCNLAVAQLKALIENEGSDTIAALVATPLRIGGSRPSADYWPEVRQICDENGILLITDEVSVGCGRLGTWLGMENFGIAPDIAVLSKGLTSGELPIGAAIAAREVAETFDSAARTSGQFQHGSTFSAHPVVMAVALENLRIIEQERLLENASQVGERLYRRLTNLLDHHRCLEYVTGGLGLLASLSIVQDRTTGRRYPGGANGPALVVLAQALRANGLSLRVSNTINIAPPLVATGEIIDRIADILDVSLTEMERAFPPV